MNRFAKMKKERIYTLFETLSWNTIQKLKFTHFLVHYPIYFSREPKFGFTWKIRCNKKEVLLNLFCGRWGIRTPDPLGVNQMLWTSWAKRPCCLIADANVAHFLNSAKNVYQIFQEKYKIWTYLGKSSVSWGGFE